MALVPAERNFGGSRLTNPSASRGYEKLTSITSLSVRVVIRQAALGLRNQPRYCTNPIIHSLFGNKEDRKKFARGLGTPNTQVARSRTKKWPAPASQTSMAGQKEPHAATEPNRKLSYYVGREIENPRPSKVYQSQDLRPS